ncbi:MAG: hypothetical protein DLM58_08275 [Pseudonocardiales bacterium]|nr:MAG: hypothetical protein DLM58_08275 [Pseudonocardiales bacterium]
MTGSGPYAPRWRLQASIRRVQEAVADYYGLNLGELLGSSRVRQLTVPRHLAIYLARELTAASLPALGQAFNRDHTSVLYAHRRVSADLTWDPCAVSAVEDLRRRLEVALPRGLEEPLLQLHTVQANG